MRKKALLITYLVGVTYRHRAEVCVCVRDMYR